VVPLPAAQGANRRRRHKKKQDQGQRLPPRPSSAGSKKSSERALTPAPVPQHARETEAPGANQRRRPWLPRSHFGRIFWQAFPGGHWSRLLHIPFSSPAQQSGPRLTGADGLYIPCWGERQMALIFHGRIFEWPFLLAKVQFPIIGVDFLRHFRLLVDPAAAVWWTQFPPSTFPRCLVCAASPTRSQPRRWRP